MGSHFIKPFLAITFAFSAAAVHACPEILQRVHSRHLRGTTLCELHDQYEELKQQLENRGLKPATRIGNIMAPRFINMPDWLAKRDQTAIRAWTIYDPAPVTWGNWDKTAQVVDQNAREIYTSGTFRPLTKDWLKQIQGVALTDLTYDSGKFRTGGEIGLAIKRENALTAEQVRAVNQISYPRVDNRERGLTSFIPTICLEDQSEQFRENYKWSYAERSSINLSDWKPVEVTTFFKADDGQAKQCGFVDYAPLYEVGPQLKLWFAYINQALKSWGSPRPEGDPIFIASRAQRWLIAIHPFSAGNGRTSRLVMDWLLESLGLPAPIVTNMNNDIYSTEEEWADQVGEGLLRTVHEAENCLQRPDLPGCQVISEKVEP